MSSGSRQFHSKSRNGCGQCKKRRVRCNLESPVCSNCRKRKEPCDYLRGQPTIVLWSTKPASSVSSRSSREPDDAEPPPGSTCLEHTTPLPVDPPGIITPRHAFPEVLLSMLEKGTMISNIEFSAWIQELNRHINKFSYLEPTVRSIQLLFQWLSGGQTVSGSYASALRYNIEASNRFRLSNVKITEANWLAILIFGIGIIIFHFCIALSSSDRDFNFLDMFYVLRESSRLGRQVGPYFLSSRLGSLLKRRYRVDGPVDDEVLAAIEHLDAVVYQEEMSADTRLLYCETVEALRFWVVMVEGYPQTWRDFIHFPENVPEAYLQSLQQKTPLALLIFIYWCAIMHRAPHRWFMDRWARRAADSAMSYLGPEWAESLEWPRTVLGSPSPSYSNLPLRARDHFSELVIFSLGQHDRSDRASKLVPSNVDNSGSTRLY
ncbi:hypothetical protein F5Y13DRAFT_204976 [Hypoxylon sp. FL1857]|nr:hypothetical protein F5Y13DRAFT_204976 [Hypoxylon sp. FL1857]